MPQFGENGYSLKITFERADGEHVLEYRYYDGQRQRLSIARALAAKSEILILDDSSSALDLATDARLRRSLASLEHSPTVFIVSQRLSSIRNCDLILVLDDGRIVGAGDHGTLSESCSVYQEIIESQEKKNT